MSDAKGPQWTVSVRAPKASESRSLVVDREDLMPLVARVLADARVEDMVVLPRIREVRAHASEPASARGEV